MPKNCSVPNCRTAPGDRRNFYKFPLHDPERLDLWLRNMGRNNWTPSRHQYICHQHFSSSNFKVCSGVRYLKNSAVPTLFQKEKVLEENERRSKWREANRTQIIKGLGLTTEAAGVQLGSSIQLELSNLGQISGFGDQDLSQSAMNWASSKDQQITFFHSNEELIDGGGTEMVLVCEGQDGCGSTSTGQIDSQGVDMDDLTCTIEDTFEISQTPDIAYFEVIPSLFSFQTPQVTFVPETVLSSALSSQPITSTVPIVSKHVQSSNNEKSHDTEDDEDDEIGLVGSSFGQQQQVEHCYHKSAMSKEQLEAFVEELQRQVKILQQRHTSHLDKLRGLEKTVGQLRQSNLLYEERLQLLERANFQANVAMSEHGQIVTIIYEEEQPEYTCTNIP